MARMTLQCPGCGLTGSIDEERLHKAGLKFRCPRCSRIHRLAPPPAEETAPPAPAVRLGPSVPPAPGPPAGSPPLPPSAARTEEEEQTSAGETGADAIPIAPQGAAPAPAAGGPAAAAAPCSLLFYGRGGALFIILLKNMFLSLFTFGFYRFWGKVKVRQYLYGQTEVGGDRLLFHGTGKELLVGWLKAVAVMFLGFMLLKGLEFLHPAFVILTNLGLLVVIGFAKVGSLRYRLSRTSLRSIRFSFRGGYGQGIGLFAGGVLLTIFTLGLYYPFYRTKLRRFWFENSYYGTTPFTYSGQGKDLFLPYLLALPLSLLTLGAYWFWFTAKMDRYDWEHTTFPGVRFASTVTGGGLLTLQATNLLLLLFTLGLALPWVLIRSLNYRFRHIVLSGHPDYERISQEVRTAQATGEGFADYMDMDFGVLDFGLF